MPGAKSTSNGVFISYRFEVGGIIAKAVFQELYGWAVDVFYEIESNQARPFDRLIADRIAARPYFLLILTPGTLERCVEPDDRLRQEIEYAVATNRVIIPAHTPGFDFGDFDRFLPGGAGQTVRRFNGQELPQRFLNYAVQQLFEEYLVPIEIPHVEKIRQEVPDKQVQSPVETVVEPGGVVGRSLVGQVNTFLEPISASEVRDIGTSADFQALARAHTSLFGRSRPGVFVSYRREDAGAYARLLESQLKDRFSDARIFMDLDSIEAGLDFADVIQEAVNTCTVFLALIGPKWATLTDEQGVRRLDNPRDFVRFEVQAALKRGRDVRTIPVLVDGAQPPRQQELPSGLKKLARLNAVRMSYDRFDDDAGRLFNLIGRLIESRPDGNG
jgi:hypothetical protein